jgi:hypothetical protein
MSIGNGRWAKMKNQNATAQARFHGPIKKPEQTFIILTCPHCGCKALKIDSLDLCCSKAILAAIEKAKSYPLPDGRTK